MSWDTVPTEEIPLRARVPKISTATRQRLIDWVLRQGPAVKEWCVKRSTAYYAQAPATVPVESPQWMDVFTVYDAAAALDLLVWQSNKTDKEAVERLAAFDAVAESVTKEP